MQAPDKSTEAPLSPWWRHATLLVMIFGFSALTVVTVLTYTNAPPIPRQVVDETGALLFTGDEIERGQEVFLKHALMEHGTLWGHGAYLGPDYTAEHLHREVGHRPRPHGHPAVRAALRGPPGERAGAGGRRGPRRPQDQPLRGGHRHADPVGRRGRRQRAPCRATGAATSRRSARPRDFRREASPIRRRSGSSTPTSRGRRGPRSRTAPARTTPTPTTGPTIRTPAIAPPPRPTCGARSAWWCCWPGWGWSCSCSASTTSWAGRGRGGAPAAGHQPRWS